MVWHARLGYTVLALLAFRLIWGFVGGHWSRWAQFPLSMSRLNAYLKGNETHLAGHSPAGAWSVVIIMILLSFQITTGLFSTDDIFFSGPLSAWVSSSASSLFTAIHKGPGKLLILLWVVLHLAAILFYARVKKRLLLPAMITGDHHFQPAHIVSSEDKPTHRLWALILFLSLLSLAFLLECLAI